MVAILFLAAMQILPLLGINMGPLLASAGIVGLAIGFGAQTLVRDFINGFLILVENQYDIGDTVQIAGVQGAVEAMTLRRTVLRDDSGALHTVPSSEIKVVSNLTRDWTQVPIHVSVAYGADSDRVIQLLNEVGEEAGERSQVRGQDRRQARGSRDRQGEWRRSGLPAAGEDQAGVAIRRRPRVAAPHQGLFREEQDRAGKPEPGVRGGRAEES